MGGVVPERQRARTAGLALAAATVAFGFAGSRLLGILRTVAIADAFGASPDLSAYWVAFRVPDLIFQLLAGATVGSAFIPVFARTYTRAGSERAWRLASNVITAVTLGTGLLCLLAFIFAPQLVPLTAPGLGAETGRRDELMDEAVTLTRIMLLSPLLFSVSGVVTGILNARRQFFLPALAPMAYNLSIILGAVVLSRPWGVRGLALGVVLGALLHLVVQVPGLFRAAMRFRPRLDLADRATREIGRLMAPRVLGLAAVQMNFVVTTFFASRVDDHAIANLSYAWVITQLPLALFAMSLSVAIFPQLADQVAAEDREGLVGSVRGALSAIMFLTIPAAIGLLLLREPATVLLLERGEFTASDSAVVASAVAFYCLGIVPQAGIEIHSRGFYALGDTRTPVAFAIVGVVANGILSAVLWREFGVEGLAFSVSAAAWLEWLLLVAVYRVRVDAGVLGAALPLARTGLAAALMGLAVALVGSGSSAGSGAAALRWAALAVVAGGVTFGAAAVALRIPEAMAALARLRGVRQVRG